MFVLGIDPGLSRCGYAVLDATTQKPNAVAIGVLRTSPDEPLPNRLAELQAEFRSLFDEFDPVALAIERVFFQHNVRTAMSVGQASGLVMAEAAGRGVAVADYSPNEVKLAVTGDGAADKTAVAQMVKMLLNLPILPAPADAADAAAVALCHVAHGAMARALSRHK